MLSTPEHSGKPGQAHITDPPTQAKVLALIALSSSQDFRPVIMRLDLHGYSEQERHAYRSNAIAEGATAGYRDEHLARAFPDHRLSAVME